MRLIIFLCASIACQNVFAQATPSVKSSPASKTNSAAAELFADENLTAWLVIFTDAKKRTPEQRAKMVADLGFKKVGFEAFEKYVPILDEQMEENEKHGLETTSVYFVMKTETPSEEPHVKAIFDVLKKRKATPEIWAMFPRGAFNDAPQEQRVEKMIVAFSELAEHCKAAGCKLALYNYGSWFGAVDVQLAIIDGVKERTGIKIGTVLNFHRGHQHMPDFPEALQKMLPHLVMVNLNGMNQKDAGKTGGGAKILPLGDGDAELTMMRQLAESGYRGPIGIIDHQSGVDAEVQLKANLKGLEELRKKL
ncbi:sugar phosphate isomerase/epimerase family protein [Fuerstiella marisgermanici]|uniref:Xylose isomerase-like TIM barrel domain-containing protein n=1 Tax=Fuerstiella marisgermanici TaxID=1891926 RepID=A0A1P8WHR7_9PLAN|nr:sugar phosphate isomerase/epimerase [Fuerstiella marisgermanici]APZ93598.1 hypothetical protein Fuma_03216 [Fuerstiella marisgermanici]